MWTSSFYLGNFVGPTVGGFLVDYYGFGMAALVMFAACCLSILIDVAELSYSISQNKETGYEQL